MTLYLQAKTQIIGMHPNRGRFAAELTHRAEAAGDTGSLRSMGVWEFVGLTGAWSRVLALYEFENGWDSVADQVTLTMRAPTPAMAELYAVADSMRSGGVDEILEAMPGCPTRAEIRTDGGYGPVLVSEEVQVTPGTESSYADLLMSEWKPVAEQHGHRLVGLYRHALTDGQLVAYWATDLAGYRSLMAADQRSAWHQRARSNRLGWRHELWTAAAGSPFAADAL